jgi:hypothetical protein
MVVEAASSRLDGRDGITLSYPAGSPFPWPGIIDEVRQLDQTTLLGMSLTTLRWRPGSRYLSSCTIRSTPMDYDYIVVGSGFGGAVSALRLAEKGYHVAVLEQGRRISPADMEAAAQDIRHLFWLPSLGWRGFFSQTIFRHVGIVSGLGVGGGSLVYAAVLVEPRPAFFSDPAWSGLGVDWQAELEPHYEAVSSTRTSSSRNPFTRSRY